MSITHYGRAIDELKRAGCFNMEEIKKGRSGADKFSSNDVENVLNWSKYNMVEALNRAGKLLKDSSWTRLTAHKMYDYAVIQSQSDTNCESYRQSLRDLIREQDPEQVLFEDLDEKVQKRILNGANAILKDAFKELNKVYDGALKNEKLKAKLDEFEKKTQQEQYEFLVKSFKDLHEKRGLSSKMVFTKSRAIEAPQSRSSGGGYVGGGGAGGGLLFIWTTMGITLLIIGEITAGAVMLGIFPGLPLLIAASAFVGYEIVDGVKAISNYRKKTSQKRQLMKLNDHLSKAIRKLNECEKYVEHQMLQALQHNPPKAEADRFVIGLTSKFLKDQAALWGHYATAKAREYEKNGLREIVNDKHESGSKIVSDEKIDRHGYQKRLGLAKQGIARTWCDLSKAFSRCYG